MSVEETVQPEVLEQERQRIRGLVEEIAKLASQNIAPDEFFGHFLERVVQALGATAGAAWSFAEGASPKLLHAVGWQGLGLAEDRHANAIQGVAAGHAPRIVEGRQVAAGSSSIGQGYLLLVPIHREDQSVIVVEIDHTSATSDDVQQGQLRFLDQMAQLAGSFLTSHRLREAGQRQSLLSRINRFADVVHSSLDVGETAAAIANEGNSFLQSDRLSVVLCKGKKWRVKAVSGQDLFDDRSRVIGLLGRLASRVAAVGQPLWYTGESKDLPPQLREALEDYVDEAHVASLAVVPLVAPKPSEESETDRPAANIAAPKVIGILIVEQFSQRVSRELLEQRLEMIGPHCTTAIANAKRHSDVWIVQWWEHLAKTRVLVSAKHLPKTVVAAVAIITLVLVLCFLPARFELKGEGRLVPVEYRDIFVEFDAEVIEVYVDHGSTVQVGDKLIDLFSSELELQLADIRGQLETTEQQKTALLRMMLEESGLSSEERDQLAGRVQESAEKLNGLEKQYRVLSERNDRLKICSPIAGIITTWDAREVLKGRPVTRGQVLITVANTEGVWELEVDLPERRIGHLLRAEAHLREQDETRLPVRYELEADPGRSHAGWVEEIHNSASDMGEEGTVVRLRVSIEPGSVEDDELLGQLLDSTVAVKVDCGQKPLGYVWLHDVYEFFQRLMF